MNHDYQKVVETMQEVGIDESYIGKTLRLYGLEEFPKSGLDDKGLSRLVKTATEIFQSEASLTTRKPKKGYLPAPKIKKEKPKNSSLETSVIKEDLKKVGKEIRNIGHVLRTPFLVPTTVRKVNDCDYDNEWYYVIFPVIGAIEGVGLLTSVIELYKTSNPKLATLLLATTVITNLASGIYEYYRHVKNKAKEKLEKLEEVKEDIHGTILP